VRSYYSKNDFYIYELIKTEYNQDRAELLEAVLDECEPGTTVVDYGAGVGIFSIPLAAKGCRVTHLDVPGRLLEFARHRFALRGLDAEFSASPGEEPLVGYYQNILSVFVVEHLVDPRRTLAHLERHLAPGGKLLLAVDFEDHRASDELLPLHLTHLDRGEYYAFMDSLGLTRLRSHRELDVFVRKHDT
jgi:2-polyprenyl-3-methyl-5-hydroxy-6-metoxy-1,4-benzoquinol methylase